MPDRSAFDLARHVAILCASCQRLTGKLLAPANVDPAVWLDQAPFALVSHDAAADPIFNYANRAALQLFEMTWDEFTATPSRLSAAPMDRDERAVLLERVTRNGYIDDYTGIRVARSGRRFMIRNATVFNLLDEQGRHYGQAAMLAQWEALQ
jgi:hypothetical protein